MSASFLPFLVGKMASPWLPCSGHTIGNLYVSLKYHSMPHASDPLSVSTARRIDAVCDRFESEWKAGRRPRIEDYLGDASGSGRVDLLRGLLQLELELRLRGKETPDSSAYKVRFPKDGPLIEAVLQSAIQKTTAHPMQASVDTSSAGESQKDSPTPRPAGPMPGRIGRFEVIERLGQGAFGQVFRARDPQLDREVAIKTPLSGALTSEEELKRFLREARAAATLRHANICPVYEVGQMGKVPFIVMALLRGTSLAEHLRDRAEPLPVKQAALIVRKLALALEAAHEKGIVHRDLKPANIMFERERRDVVIMDFGLARRTIAGDPGQTREGTLLGSPAYMAPEQARGDIKAVGPASDQYSLGVILYELLASRLPFRGTIGEVLG